LRQHAALASAIAEGAQGAGATVRLLRVPEIAPPSEDASPRLQEVRERMACVSIASNDDLVWADGVAFGSPTRSGNMCAELKRFIDQTGSLWLSGTLVGKVAGVFCTTSTMHGGQESTLLSMMVPIFHLGFLIQGLPTPEGRTPRLRCRVLSCLRRAQRTG
jgi:NAD(P)H dehydrogenase (quinone)